MNVDARPCSSCPYRRDTPSGVWAPDEYVKLPTFDDGVDVPALGVFLCHHSTVRSERTVCRGWLTVHRESVAVRLAVVYGHVTDAERYADVDADLYDSGAEACAAGLAGVDAPNVNARSMIDRLVRRGVGKVD